MLNNILELPLDVLILIFERLETLEDKKNFARAHPKLREVIYHSRKDVLSEIILYNKRECVNYWEFLLEWWGPNLSRIENFFRTVDSGILIELAAKYCPNLENLKLELKDDDIEKLKDNLPKLKKLKEFTVRYYRPSTHNSSDYREYTIIKVLQKLTQLRQLYFNFDCLNKNTREELNKLTQLESLEIRRFKPEHVIDITDLLGKLRVLRIHDTDTITLSHFAEHCINLEELKLDDYNITSDFPHFPKLTNIEIRIHGNYLLNKFVSKLNNPYNNQLQVFNINYLSVGKAEVAHITKLKALRNLFVWEISADCIAEIVEMPLEKINIKSMTYMDHLRLVKECSTLTGLYCEFREIDMEFLPKLLNILKAKGFQAVQPFQLNICTPFDSIQTIKKQLATLPNSNLLNISYEKYY